jgi:O-antigen chain-terminating methyltransferase
MIERLISSLPEVYQPIYGHPELSTMASRSCDDRLRSIVRIHDALAQLLGRTLTVLDLGCAQGFFSFNLAKVGATVHGVDYLDANIALCNALASENTQLPVKFETGRIEKIIEHLSPNQYDLVLGLSVFHHIAYERGEIAVREMLNNVASRSGALVVEFATREEPVYWASALPESPHHLVESIAFVREVSRHKTHLSSVDRPLIVASNRFWVVGDTAAEFDSFSLDPHILANGTHKGSRRYYFGRDSILKQYRFGHERDQHNRTNFKNERMFLENPPPTFLAPKLLAVEESESSAELATEKLPGRLLLDLLREGSGIDSRAVLLGVLQKLTALEAKGLFHDDVRVWNVLVADDKAIHLIDYGAISPKKRDCVWPEELFLAFLIFVREVTTGVIENFDPIRTVAISPYRLPEPYRQWTTSFWGRPLSQWSFQEMYETLLELPTEVDAKPLLPNAAWINAIEEAIQANKLFVNGILRQTEAKQQETDTRIRQLELNIQKIEAKIQPVQIANDLASETGLLITNDWKTRLQRYARRLLNKS